MDQVIVFITFLLAILAFRKAFQNEYKDIIVGERIVIY